MLTIRTLGEVSFAVDGEPVKPLRSRTAAALLVYLACHPRPFSREYLAEFFWPGRAASQSSANLRTNLKLLRPTFGDYLLIERQAIGFNHDADFEIDAHAFADPLETWLPTLDRPLQEPHVERLTELLNIYQGRFLEGFFLTTSPDFEAWQREEQSRYQRLAEHGLRQLVAYFLANGKYRNGIEEATRLLTFDPLDETLHQDMMKLLWRGGQRDGALQQYVALKTLLDSELGLPPSPETTRLFERIRSAPSSPRHNLPQETAVFVGRKKSLAELEANLSKSECRLMTILGPGGVGKTRLLLELGRRTLAAYPGQFADGVRFFSLAQLDSGRFLATSLAMR